eukprot:PITA_27227
MGCITSVSFDVLINGVASSFFKAQRGLRQGCPLSPLLFLLVAEGLSQLILEARREEVVKGLELAVNMFISHLLFVDDILLFTNGSVNEIKELKSILDLFMKAIGMQVNHRKSQLIMEEWIRNPIKKGRNILVVWKATTEAFKVIEQGLAWQVGNGEKLRKGKDLWVGCNGQFALSPGLIRQLESRNIFHLNQVEKIGQSTIWGQAWKSGEELDLRPYWWNEWKAYTQELTRSNVRLKDSPDRLVWAHAEFGAYSPKFGYKFLMSKKGWEEPEWWANQLWKLKCPKKARLFFWCTLKKKIPTWEILQSRFKQGPGRCPLCKADSESINHLFLKCPFAKRVWGEVQNLLQKQLSWEGDTISGAWEKWWKHHTKGNLRNLPPIICWGVG